MQKHAIGSVGPSGQVIQRSWSSGWVHVAAADIKGHQEKTKTRRGSRARTPASMRGPRSSGAVGKGVHSKNVSRPRSGSARRSTSNKKPRPSSGTARQPRVAGGPYRSPKKPSSAVKASRKAKPKVRPVSTPAVHLPPQDEAVPSATRELRPQEFAHWLDAMQQGRQARASSSAAATAHVRRTRQANAADGTREE